MSITCPYCGYPAELTTGGTIYKHRRDLHHKIFFICRPCDAYVGCHPNSSVALGSPANAELRAARVAAHGAFDNMWKSGGMTRSAAYEWLRDEFNLTSEECHIGLFDLELCRRVQEACGRDMFG